MSMSMSMVVVVVMGFGMSMFIIMAMIVPTVIVLFHPDHLTLVVPGPTYSRAIAGVVALPHNTVKFA